MYGNLTALREMEKIGTVLFHGTTNGEIAEFEPRQAMSHGEADGDPCIAASRYLDPAIFMAIFSGRVACGWDSNGHDFGFYLKRRDYNTGKAESWKGFIYTFDRSAFSIHGGWEWRAYQRVKPLMKFEVTFTDLPRNIDLL